MRTKAAFRTDSREQYLDFRKKYPNINIDSKTWRNIVRGYNEGFRDHLLETGEKKQIWPGFWTFAVAKKRVKRTATVDGKQRTLLSVDWKKTKELGKRVYHLNFHTEGYSFYWKCFKESATFRFSYLWYFKSGRDSARSITKKIKENPDTQHLYFEWDKR